MNSEKDAHFENTNSLPTLYLGWADLHSSSGGGYNVYTKSLLAADNNPQLYYLRSSGKTALFSSLQKPVIRYDGTFHGAKCFRFDNNPIYSPTTEHYSDAYLETSGLIDTIKEFVENLRIQKIIIQSHEGFPLALIERIKRTLPQIQICVFVHDAFYICPKVHLFKYYLEPCFNNNSGLDCRNCARGNGIFLTRLKNSLRQFPRLKQFYKKMKAQKAPTASTWNGADYNNKILKSVTAPLAPNSLLAQHRASVQKSLLLADQIVCFSSYYSTLLKAVYPDIKSPEIQRIFLPHFSDISQQALLQKATAERSVTLGFHGVSNSAKGLDLLLTALRQNQLFLSGKFQLKLLLNEPTQELSQFENEFGSRVQIHYGFNSSNLPGELSEIDISVFTSRLTENSPLTVLEALHAGHFIVAPKSGGTPELLFNEFSELYTPNDFGDLNSAIDRIYKKLTNSIAPKQKVLESIFKK